MRPWWNLRKPKKLNPDLNEIYFHLGQVYRFKSWWDEAVSEFQKYMDSPNPEEEKSDSIYRYASTDTSLEKRTPGFA